ncbi:hypothetical protein HanRHA438_Chr03g0120551 [Helianthus annuus]|nr:hypothetical protein HanRHA438_Chr03g0120551 [Helianthus annuus]
MKMPAKRLKNPELKTLRIQVRLLSASSSSKHADQKSSLAKMVLQPCFTGSTQSKSLCARADVLSISALSMLQASSSPVL